MRSLSPRTNSGFLDFTYGVLFALQYRLPARFDTIPLMPISQAFANTIAPSADMDFAERDAADAKPQQRISPRFECARTTTGRSM